MSHLTRAIALLLTLLTLVPAQACEDGELCIEQGEWHLAIAMGAGLRTNPLVDGDNIPLVILPDIAWYGEAAYFDNGELGYQWSVSDKFAHEVFVAPNLERANFTFWDTANIFVPFNVAAPDALEPEPPESISVDQIASRRWTLDAGWRGHWYTNNGDWQISVAHDALNVHNGWHARLAYRHHWHWSDWRLTVSPYLHWLSNATTDYYYGIDARDTSDERLFYQASSGVRVGIAATLSHRLSENWTLVFNASYLRLHSGMTDSPLVDRDQVVSGFVGFSYRF